MTSPLPRRRATAILRRGRVTTPAGEPLRDAKLRIPPAELPRDVLLDGRPVTLRLHAHLLQHKPAGHVTALSDPRHPTAADLLDGAPLRAHLRAVGRLDKDTTGLLLWTTDGTLLHRLTHPRYQVPRTYQARLARPHDPLPDDLALDHGHRPRVLDLRPLAPADAHPALLPDPDASHLAEITLVGGRFHEVRRIFAALGSHVCALCRTRYGDLELPRDLPAGAHLEVDLPATMRGRHPEDEHINI